MSSKITVIGYLDYVSGYLRYGHLELEVEETLWDSLSKEEQLEYLKHESEFILDDYSLEDMGDVFDIDIYKDGGC